MSTAKQDVQAETASAPRHSEEFKRDAVRLVTEESYTFAAAAKAVGVSDQTLRLWRKKFGPPPTPPRALVPHCGSQNGQKGSSAET